MRRFIPKNNKVRNSFFKDFKWKDLIIIFIEAIILILIVVSNVSWKWFIALIYLCLCVVSMVSFDDKRFYEFIIQWFVYMTGKKHFKKKDNSIRQLQPYNLIAENMIQYPNYFSCVVKISPIEFALMTEEDQDIIIQKLATCFNVLADTYDSELHIVKTERPQLFDKPIIHNSYDKVANLTRTYERGDLSEDEYKCRLKILENNDVLFNQFNENKLMQQHFYFQIFSSSKKSTLSLTNMFINELRQSDIFVKQLDSEELGVYIKNAYVNQFDERNLFVENRRDVEINVPKDVLDGSYQSDEIYNELMPSNVDINWAKCKVDNIDVSHISIKDYPLMVTNAWGFDAFHIPNTRAVLRMKYCDSSRAIRDIDKSIRNLRTDLIEKQKTSELSSVSAHIETLEALQEALQHGNEKLFDVNFSITAYDKPGDNVNRREAKRIINNSGLKTEYNYGTQLDAYLAEQPTKRSVGKTIGINSTSLASFFPFVRYGINEENGVFIGESANCPCFLDVFKKDHKLRINSNMMVIGTSGAGKSYFTKTLLTQLLPSNTKIIGFDPEGEYVSFCNNVGGSNLDVGSGKFGRINPFHIIEELQDENGYKKNSFDSHLVFLESFLRRILPTLDDDAFEYLNNIIIELYKIKHINNTIDTTKLLPEDYPIFDELYKLIEAKLKQNNTPYELKLLQIIETHLAKFSSSGRLGHLWNGPTTIDMDSMFVNFDFRSMFASVSQQIANAQMLLILRFSNIEVIRNKEFNSANNDNRKLVIYVDEAHLYFNENFMVALDFFEQLARRARKYDAMVMFTTQSIGDFVANESISSKTKAILDVTQYPVLFKQKPNSINTLKELFKNSTPLNDFESKYLVGANQGEALLIINENERIALKIVATHQTEKLFGEINNADNES